MSKNSILQDIEKDPLEVKKLKLLKMIDDELLSGNPDMELVDDCMAVLDQYFPVEVPDFEPNINQKHHHKSRTAVRIAVLIAALIAIFSIAAAAASYVVGENIFSYIVRIFSDRVEVDYNKDQQAGDYLPADTDLRKTLEEKGITPVLLAEDYLSEYKVSASYMESEFVNSATFDYTLKKAYVQYNISQYVSSDFIGQSEHRGDYVSSKELFVNNLDMLVLDLGDKRSISFVDNTTEYLIFTDLNMVEAVKLAESIK